MRYLVNNSARVCMKLSSPIDGKENLFGGQRVRLQTPEEAKVAENMARIHPRYLSIVQEDEASQAVEPEPVVAEPEPVVAEPEPVVEPVAEEAVIEEEATAETEAPVEEETASEEAETETGTGSEETLESVDEEKPRRGGRRGGRRKNNTNEE